MKPVKILRVAGEGGGLVIYGRHSDGSWSFKLTTSDHTPTLLDEDPIYRESGWVTTLAEAIAPVGYAWNSLKPVEVHPDFGAEIFRLKLEKDLERPPWDRHKSAWEELCGMAASKEARKIDSDKSS